ncbi:MAG: hypothetical protein ACFCU6_14265 [Balneolaceae bacterium]
MMLIYIIYFFFIFIGGFAGFSSRVRIENLNKRNLLNSTLIVLFIFTVLMIAYVAGYFPQSVAAPFMAVIYSFIAGFFIGYAFRLLNLRASSGNLLYVHRSFWIDHAPNLLAIILMLFGLYRTALLTSEPVTDIRVTSGVSLFCFGLFGWTIKLVPEFRSNGILLFDKKIPWNHVIAWRWHSNDVIRIEFISDIGKKTEGVREFMTAIPEDERLEIETILKSKMEEHEEERRKILLKPDN